MKYLIYLVFLLSNLSCSPLIKYSQSNWQFEEEVSLLESLDFEQKAGEDDLLFNIMNSADYLEYEYLLDKACDKLSDDILKCNSVDEVKKKFKITREFTEEEENSILKDIKL